METAPSLSLNDEPSLFKSYYVVWKLSFTSRGVAGVTRFKSYYVVWKLTQANKSFAKHNRLNRTMQYGNFGIVDPPDAEKKV